MVQSSVSTGKRRIKRSRKRIWRKRLPSDTARITEPSAHHHIVSKLHARQIELDEPLSRQDATDQELQHHDIAGLREFDRFAHEFFCFAFQQRRGDKRSAIFRPWFAPWVAVLKRTAASGLDLGQFWA